MKKTCNLCCRLLVSPAENSAENVQASTFMLNTVYSVIKPNWLKERILWWVSNRSLPWAFGMCGASGACQSTGQGWVLPPLYPVSGAKHQLCVGSVQCWLGLLEARPHPPLRLVMHSSWRSPAFSACLYCSKIDLRFSQEKPYDAVVSTVLASEEWEMKRLACPGCLQLHVTSIWWKLSPLCLHLSLASFSWIPFCRNDTMF